MTLQNQHGEQIGSSFQLIEEGNELTLNMGPHHPSTHGVLRFILKTDGEVLRRCVPDVGFLHRAIESIGEKCTYDGFMPYTDRVDYIAAMFANHCYALAVEELLELELPRRAEYLRVISDELNRMASHLLGLGAMAMDIGAVTPFLHMLREREHINTYIEELCGQRITYNYQRIGGVSHDLPHGWRDRLLDYLDHFEKVIPELNRLVTGNQIFIERSANVGAISAQQAISYGLVGPNLRSSGVDFDLRRDRPYSAYPEFEFEVPVGRGEMGTIGDCYDRFVVRIQEMQQSISILRQALLKLPTGNHMAKMPKKIKPDAGLHAYSRIESARGEMLGWVMGSGGKNAWRVRFRTGSFNAMGIIEEISRGMMLADVIAFIASLDIIAPEIDR
ncbi:MAG: NADH-quinone oxidoreductase subunit NuoD [Myxococcales bacterium]|nr:NADH-quinone oxidoreductase subunit NuoD [Myxococcales bacterium]